MISSSASKIMTIKRVFYKKNISLISVCVSVCLVSAVWHLAAHGLFSCEIDSSKCFTIEPNNILITYTNFNPNKAITSLQWLYFSNEILANRFGNQPKRATDKEVYKKKIDIWTFRKCDMFWAVQKKPIDLICVQLIWSEVNALIDTWAKTKSPKKKHRFETLPFAHVRAQTSRLYLNFADKLSKNSSQSKWMLWLSSLPSLPSCIAPHKIVRFKNKRQQNKFVLIMTLSWSRSVSNWKPWSWN